MAHTPYLMAPILVPALTALAFHTLLPLAIQSQVRGAYVMDGLAIRMRSITVTVGVDSEFESFLLRTLLLYITILNSLFYVSPLILDTLLTIILDWRLFTIRK